MRHDYRIIERRLVEVDDHSGSIVVYVQPTATERRYLIEELRIDDHTFASALDPDELSRLEFEPEHIALIYKRPRNYSGREQFLFRVSSAGLFLFKGRLVVVMPEEQPLLDGNPIVRVQSAPGVLLTILARSIIHFREHLKGISLVSDELQNEINRSMENRHLINMFALQKSLVYYVNSISSNGALLEKLNNNAAKIGLGTEELEFLDDIIIENNQCYKQAEMYSNILASLMDARASIVSNNLNVLMKTLNIITIAIMVPTLVVSIFSMNVALPLQEHRFAFWIILAIALTSAVGFMTYWRRRRW